MTIIRFISVVSLFTILTTTARTQNTGFEITTRYDFYTQEETGEVLLMLPPDYVWRNLEVTVKINNDTLGFWKGIPRKSLISINIELNLPPSKYNFVADIKTISTANTASVGGELSILPYKSNEVKIDKLSGGLIVNKKEFFPFGFYCYTPIHSTLPEEEAVKGFNMISPYQTVLPATIDQRKVYMDRCAELGIKVHYNLLSVSGGGGVNSEIEGIKADSLKKLLKNEITTFMDHPALLAWYISDEPFPSRITPDSMNSIYRFVKDTDPWHPVSIVFMAPFTSTAAQYTNALDIVMADPYPIPDLQPAYTGIVANSLYNEFYGKKPVWMATQSFGGGEIWRREPTSNEIRIMTYMSIINGATGIQFFIRHGLNIYPKSTATWGECGKIAMEIQELTPWLLSTEDNIPVNSSSSSISLLSKTYNGKLMIMAANRTNSTRRVEFTVQENLTGRAQVIFENRLITTTGNSFADYLSPYGTQVYLIDIDRTADSIVPYPDNMLTDPGFEENSSPGIPSSCYAWNIGDRGATFFTDTREYIEGTHSIRLRTPKQNESIRLRFFPVPVTGGTTYYITIWAKGDSEQSIQSSGHQYFELSFGNFGTKRFRMSDQWEQYICGFTIPNNENIPDKLNVALTMSSQGVGWFDLLQVFEGVDIGRSFNPEIRTRPFWQ